MTMTSTDEKSVPKSPTSAPPSPASSVSTGHHSSSERRTKVRKQHRPRAAKQGEAMTAALSDMAARLAGHNDAKKDDSDDEDTILNSHDVREVLVQPERFIYTPYKPALWPTLFFYGSYVFIAVLGTLFASSLMFRALWVCSITVTCYLVRRMLRLYYTHDMCADRLPVLQPVRAPDDVSIRNYETPVVSAPSSSMRCGLYWLAMQICAFEDGLNYVRTGICRHRGSWLQDSVTHDVRLSNQRANKPVEDRVRIHRYDVWSFVDGTGTAILCVEEIVDQVAVKLRLLSEKDRALQADHMATRVTNLMISGYLFPEIVRGSAHMARIAVTNRDHADEPFKSRPTHAAPVIQCYAAIALLAAFGAIFNPALAAVASKELAVVLLLCPIGEELLKTILTNFCGFRNRVLVSLFFGLLEWAWRGFDPNQALALVAHLIFGHMTTKSAIVAHMVWNSAVVIFLTYLQEVTSPHCISPIREPRDFCRQRLDPAHPYCDIPDPDIFCDAVHALKTTRFNCPLQDLNLHQEVVQQDFVTAASCHSAHSDGVYQRAGSPHYSVPDGVPIAASLTSLACLLVGVVALPIVLRYSVGYRIDDVPLPGVPAHSADVKTFPSYHHDVPRRSHSCTLGFDIHGVAPPAPDFDHGPTVLHGCLLRFCKDPPKPNRQKLRRLKRFTEKFVRKHYAPLPADADVSLETWLSGTNYTEARKNELRKVWAEREEIIKKDTEIDGFAKKESYESYKPARGINSRSDRFKCATGPFFKLMEEQVYHQECWDGQNFSDDPATMSPFIKHIPVHLRPRFINSYLGSYPGCYYETDYSQFEKHFTPEVMQSLEMILYRHMLKNFPAAYRLIERTMCGKNKCNYRHFSVKIKGRRMSGEMCTSLGNGFSNLMLFKFAAHERGGEAVGVVEGDDALFYSSVKLSTEDFAQLGFDIKILVHNDLLSSCFCGMTMSRDFSILRNPRKVLLKFPWTFSPLRNAGSRIRLALLRAKALSLAYECPKCPILFALAKRVLQLTDGIEARFTGGVWDRQVEEWAQVFRGETLAALQSGPSSNDRTDFFLLYDIPPATQLAIEERISKWCGEPMTDALVLSLFESVEQKDYFERFTFVNESVLSSMF